MKKTMFSTSVIMVVVMAIALTTSSLAWFSAAGASNVTTSALTIKAQSTTSSGLQITDNPENVWGESISLASGNAVDGMMPLVPLSMKSNESGYEIANADLIEALAGITSGTRTIDFIGNKTINDAGTLKFAYAGGADSTTGAVSPYTTGWFSKDIYIASLATGEPASETPSSADDINAREVYVTPSISFSRRDGNTGDFTDYPTSSEGIANLTNEPTLMVAILADVTDTDNEATWELVQLFSSKIASSTKTTTTVNVGKTEENFASGQSANNSYASFTASLANSGKTSTKLAKATGGAVRGQYKQFKVVAWYDGSTLNSNNNNVQIQFTLTFTAKAQ